MSEGPEKLVARLEDDHAPALECPHVLLAAEPTDALLGFRPAGDARPQRDAGAVLAWPRDDAQRTAAERALAPHAASLHRMREVVHWDLLAPPTPEAVVLVYFVRRREGLSFADFESHYRERHAPLARTHHPGIARYVQNFRDEADEGSAVDAISELWFAREADARDRLYRDDDSRRIIADDVQTFLDLGRGTALATRPR